MAGVDPGVDDGDQHPLRGARVPRPPADGLQPPLLVEEGVVRGEVGGPAQVVRLRRLDRGRRRAAFGELIRGDPAVEAQHRPSPEGGRLRFGGGPAPRGPARGQQRRHRAQAEGLEEGVRPGRGPGRGGAPADQHLAGRGPCRAGAGCAERIRESSARVAEDRRKGYLRGADPGGRGRLMGPGRPSSRSAGGTRTGSGCCCGSPRACRRSSSASSASPRPASSCTGGGPRSRRRLPGARRDP